jgi:hypothetical protein
MRCKKISSEELGNAVINNENIIVITSVYFIILIMESFSKTDLQ